MSPEAREAILMRCQRREVCLTYAMKFALRHIAVTEVHLHANPAESLAPWEWRDWQWLTTVTPYEQLNRELGRLVARRHVVGVVR